MAVKAAVILVLIALLVVNPMGNSVATAINSQEFFTYHMRDILEYLDKEKETSSEYYLATGTYENEIDGPLFGAAAGRNLIVIQVESLQNMMIGAEYEGQELTPVLNELIEEAGTVYFNNYYQQVGGGNTSDAEFASNNSMLGAIESYTYQLFEDNYFKGLPWILKEQGYSTAVFHGYKRAFWNRENIYPALGFDTFYGDTEFVNDNIKGIGGGNIVGISDHAFFQQSVEYMKTLPEPYYSFLVTLSSHNPFGLPDELAEIELLPEDENIFGNYLNSVRYADKCLGEFLELLKEEGMYENSLIAIYGDHFGLTKADPRIDAEVSDWLGYEYTYDNMLNIPLLIHIPGSEVNETIGTSGGQIDLMPTLAYLLGLETLPTLYLGQNLFTAESGLAPVQTHMIKGSFIKDEVVFEMSRDGVFANSRAWNRYTREPVDFSGLEDDYIKAKEMIELNNFYLYNDVLRLALEENKSMEEITAKLSGNDSLSRRMQLFDVAADDPQQLADFVAYMRKNKDEQVLLKSDDLQLLLETFEDRYSGVTGKVGTIKSVDETVNQEFLDIRSRIIPFLPSTAGYTKLEYLGYDKIMVKIKPEHYTPELLNSFIEANQPCALAMTYEDMLRQYTGLLQGETPVFVCYADFQEQTLARSLGAYGVTYSPAQLQ